VNAAGWKGKAVSGQTATPVEPGEVKLVILPKEYATGTELSTNAETEVTWQREEAGEWNPVANSETYLLTANDAGKRIRAMIKRHVTEPTEPIPIKTEINSLLRAVIRSRVLKFIGETSRGGQSWLVVVDETGIVVKAKGVPDKIGRWATVKCNAIPGTKDEMLLYLDPSAKFVMKPNMSNDPRLAKALGAHVRDYVVAAIDHFSHGGRNELLSLN
jgi:hypothetical protein